MSTTTEAAPALITYTVSLATAHGTAVLEVPSCLGPDAAGRRAYWTAVHAGWGDLDDVTVTDVATPCPDVACDTETHWRGEDPVGPCPRWGDTGSPR